MIYNQWLPGLSLAEGHTSSNKAAVWGFPSKAPQKGWFPMEHPIKIWTTYENLGVPMGTGTTILGTPHILRETSWDDDSMMDYGMVFWGTLFSDKPNYQC